MGRKIKRPEYRIIGAYDSETCNINGRQGIFAYPVLHQLGLLDTTIDNIDSSNVEQHTRMHLYRHALDLYCKFDELLENDLGYVPVICCHNLAFDMYSLSAYFDRCGKVSVLAKSCRKPITFTVYDGKRPALVFWDTLVFTQQSLRRMGEDCGYSKASGEWDYDLIRTPETELTEREIDYATKDVYALLAYLAWFIKRNPDIEAEKLACKVMTKTGVVRERRYQRFANVKGIGNGYTIGKYWRYLNQSQKPKDDDELFTMMGATRGGFTFCASNHASEVYELDNQPYSIVAYDATSMHPAQMVSHVIPVDFHPASKLTLDNVFHIIERCTVSRILQRWYKPFNSAVYACYRFINLRPREDTLYKEHGILPLASARFTPGEYEINELNQDNSEFKRQSSYHDEAIEPVCAFGKLVSAKEAKLYLTELGIWEVCQCYQWDSVEPLHGYVTGHFVKPSDMSIVSVMQFYKAKGAFKNARSEFYSQGRIEQETAEKLRSCNFSDYIVNGMVDGTATKTDIESEYMSAKANLNSLYGIECSNEYRRDTVLTESGIAYTGEHGISNAPKEPKAHYQFGQRIVGWSRIAQHIALQLLEPYATDIINGDTDSIKICIPDDFKQAASLELLALGQAIDEGKTKVCERVKRCYPDLFDELKGIGYYVREFETKRFCASWNKAYCMQSKDKEGNYRFEFTIAGIPTEKISRLADRLYASGLSFGQIADRLLGYNVTFAYDLLHLNSRVFPEWGEISLHRISDYKGNISNVTEPAAMALYPMSKTVNNTRNRDNAANLEYAYSNRRSVNDKPILVTERGIYGSEMG